VQINYNKHIVHKPKVEDKTKQHYDFIKKQFDAAYLSYKDFMERDDMFVVVIRNGNSMIVAMCLVRSTPMEERKAIIPPKEENPHLEKTSDEGSKETEKPKLPPRIEYETINFNIHRIVFTLVDTYYRGKGYNQELLDFVYDNAKELGDVRYLVANIRESNKASINSFMKNGFKLSKRMTKPYSNGEKKIRVVKFIKKNVPTTHED